MSVLSKIGLYLRTVRHLKLVQITNRLYRMFVKTKPNYAPAPSLKKGLNPKTQFISRPESLLDNDSFDFLNLRNSLLFPAGWNDNSIPKLWLYNLHYFEGLLNEVTPKAVKKQVIKQWIKENPAGNGNGWEPYPNSLRICNWIKWHITNGELSVEAIHSLAVQIRFLEKNLEYHLLGNHLLANAKALIFAGIFFEGEEAEKWRCKGMNILIKQLPQQFLEDGGHFELSTTYHTLLTEDLLDIHHLLALSGTFNDAIDATIRRALFWLKVMTRPDGALPLFNDAAYGVTPTTKEIFCYSSALGFEIPLFDAEGMTDLPESGYYRYDNPDYYFIGDAGQIGPSYLPGHAHCDMLSFEFGINGLPYLVDTGTSTYDIGPERHFERSTEAHNTVQIGEYEQSEIWGAFRVGHRAKLLQRFIRDTHVNAMLISKGGVHQREIFFDDSRVVIKDAVNSQNFSILNTARFHFHPRICPVIENGEVITPEACITFHGAVEITVRESSYAPEFNKRYKNFCVEVTFSKNLRTTINIVENVFHL